MPGESALMPCMYQNSSQIKTWRPSDIESHILPPSITLKYTVRVQVPTQPTQRTETIYKKNEMLLVKCTKVFFERNEYLYLA